MPWFNSILNTVADKYGFRKIDAAERDQLRHREASEILKFLGIPCLLYTSDAADE